MLPISPISPDGNTDFLFFFFFLTNFQKIWFKNTLPMISYFTSHRSPSTRSFREQPSWCVYAITDLKLHSEWVFNISVNFEIRNKQQFFQLWVAWTHFVLNPMPFFHICIITNWRSGTLYPNTSETTPTWINSNSWQELVQTTFSPWFFFFFLQFCYLSLFILRCFSSLLCFIFLIWLCEVSECPNSAV